MSRAEPTRIDRREAIKWMLSAAAAASLLDRRAGAAPAPEKGAAGYGKDPDLLKDYKPGELWPLTFTPEQRTCAVALCDLIIPSDAVSPSASGVGVPDFLDEWISAPYPGHDADKRIILTGLAWMDAEARKRFGNAFSNLVAGQKNAICDDVCHVPDAKPEHREAAQFFRRFRDLAAGGYYTTPAGMKDIGYVGNVPIATFDGPPPAVLKQLGLA